MTLFQQNTTADPSITPVRGEMIGRTSTSIPASNLYPAVTVDKTRADYQYWDRVRRGKAAGYSLGGLFTEPIAEIYADWVLGGGADVTTGDEYTDQAIAQFISDNLAELSDWYFEAVTLGDGYMVVNPDGTLTHVSPDLVTVEVDPLNPRHVLSYTITTRPNEKTLIKDTYREDERVIEIRTGGVTHTERYRNLTSRIPVIHLPEGRSANEVYGHPAYEGLRPLFAEYDDVLGKAVSGVKVMGNPIPTVTGCENPLTERANNVTDTDTVYNKDGDSLTREVIDFESLDMFFFGTGTKFEFVAPGQFTQDTTRVLEILFLLMLQRSRVPEWAWGGAISSSKASVEAQMPAFARFIEKRQRKFNTALIELVQVWLAYRALIDPRIQIADSMTVVWPEVTPKDEALRLDWATALYDRGAITTETMLRLSALVDDPAAEATAALAEQEAANQPQIEERNTQSEIERLADQPDGEEIAA